MVPVYHVSLDNLWNDYLILVCYKFNSITASTKKSSFMYCAFKFGHEYRIFPLIKVYYSKDGCKCALSKFIYVI